MLTTAASYKRHRFPPAIIAHAISLYLRFSLSLRAVEEMLLERGVEVCYETLRRWIEVRPGDRPRPAPPTGPSGSDLASRRSPGRDPWSALLAVARGG